MRIEDYAFLGDTHSAALISRDGSIDWLCLPRFDSSACFAALLDEDGGGHWRIAPVEAFTSTRAYREESMVLETTFATDSGVVMLVDCLALESGSDPHDPREVQPFETLVRLVIGISGSVEMRMDYVPRFDYGEIVPWIKRNNGVIEAVGGPDALDLHAPVEVACEAGRAGAVFTVSEGERLPFAAVYHHSHLRGELIDLGASCESLIEQTDEYWREWAARCTYDGRWRPQIVRSLLVLKALTYSPTGGLVAAPTTSLPEDLGGVRNWDYRYCWLRDATFTIEVLLDHGYKKEAAEWRDWLLRAVAGDPEDLQIMYGVMGERRLVEMELPWLSGYEGSQPVRIGNAAVTQFQLDVYGEVMDTLHSATRAGLDPEPASWELQANIVEFVCERWRKPDNGIWEVRSGPRHFVHSKVMAWVAVDRGVSMIENFGHEGPVEHWRSVRDEIRADVMTHGYDEELGRFKRAYDDGGLDASLLALPLVGFIEATDERMRRTIEAIQRDLEADGFIHRYDTSEASDGLEGDEGSFIMCALWLVDCLVLIGRHEEAQAVFDKILSVSNDLGLLAEQFDTAAERLVGNFPQAFSHVALVTAATALERGEDAPGLRRGRAAHRRE